MKNAASPLQEVALAGSVDSAIASRRAEATARDVAGVSRVRNALVVRSLGDHRAPSPGDPVNRALGAAGAR